MVDELRPPPPDDLSNPYAAPQAEIGTTAWDFGLGDDEAEYIRRTHLNHEANIKSIGSLIILGGIFLTLGAVLIVSGVGNNPGATTPLPTWVATLYGILGPVSIVLGVGLQRLQPWARWTQVVLAVLGMLGGVVNTIVTIRTQPQLSELIGCFAVVGFLINGCYLYLLLSPKATMIFSSQYKEIIAKTPHIRCRTSLLVKIFVGLFLFLVAFMIIAGIIAALLAKR
jgi:hypothetical protein